MQENTRETVLIQLLQQCIPVVDVCTQILVPYTVEPKIICCLWSWDGSTRADKLEVSIRSLLHIVDHLCIYSSEVQSRETEREVTEILRKLDRLIPWTLCTHLESEGSGPFAPIVQKIMQTEPLKWTPKHTYVMYLLRGETLHSRTCDSVPVQLPFNDLLKHDAYVGNFTDIDDALNVPVRRRFLIRSTLQHRHTSTLERPLWKHHYIFDVER